jgi:hypothetical protein
MARVNEIAFTPRAMKTVLKDVNTGLLFRNMDEWTSSLEAAAGFRDTLTALKFCQRNNLAGVSVVHAYSDGSPHRVVGFHRRFAARGASGPEIPLDGIAGTEQTLS